MNGSRAAQVRAEGRWAERDFNISPMIVFYEVTRACDLVCLHCRACAQSRPDPNELTSEQSRQLIDQVARFPVRPMLVLTGGDPLKRVDIYDLIAYSRGQGLETAITPSPTPLVTTEAITRLQKAGIDRMAVSIDGADAATHDRMRGVPGSFAQTQRIMEDARNLGIAVQVNTTLNPDNVDQIEVMAEMRIALDMAWPQIVSECASSMQAVFPDNRIMSYRAEAGSRCGVVSVSTRSSLSVSFPQHGPGPKHRRPITLADWQAGIIHDHPEPFIRGLIHSDGCRFVNRVRTGGKTYAYPRYNFTNVSDDIRTPSRRRATS